MRVSLQKPGSKFAFLSAALLLATAYLFFASREYLAAHFSANPTPENLQRAIRLQPGNALYRYLQGQYFSLVQPSPEQAVQSFAEAVRLNPHQARYWFELAGAQQLLGNLSAQREALERAVAADPTTPDVAWEAANFYVVQGEIDKAMQELRVVLSNDPYLPASALPLCWRLKPDADFLLSNVLPRKPDVYSTFIEFLASRNETSALGKVWDQLSQLNQPVARRTVFVYVRYLLAQKEIEQAQKVWRQAATLSDLTAYQPSSENLVVNPDFSMETLNDGFDWIAQPSRDVSLSLDATQFHTGHRSLLISYDTSGIEDSGIRQFIPVKPDTGYSFSAFFRAENLEGAGGLRFILQDVYNAKTYFASDNLDNVDFWKPVNGTFSTGHDTQLLVLRVQREPAGRPIKGRLWIDDMRLSPIRMQAAAQ